MYKMVDKIGNIIVNFFWNLVISFFNNIFSIAQVDNPESITNICIVINKITDTKIHIPLSIELCLDSPHKPKKKKLEIVNI